MSRVSIHAANTTHSTLPTISRDSADPHRYSTATPVRIHPDAEYAPVITEDRHDPVRWVPETHYLTIVDPTRTEGEQDFTRLMVLAHHRKKDEEVLIDFRSNNDSFSFVLNALHRHFEGTLCFVESWPAEEDEF